MSGSPLSADPAPLLASLRRMELLGARETAELVALEGGVSSDIYRALLPSGAVCVKRALARLKVAADWQAPVARNRYEVAWMRVVAEAMPTAVPAILGEDPEGGAFAMAWLPPDRYPVWKALLRDGTIDPDTAAAVGDALGRIHAATADQPQVAARFPTDEIFYAIRLEPYLVAAGRAHPDLAGQLASLVATTQAHKRVLVHGDFSPKNMLIGPAGPVFLDAECAWWGDPAFDVAFVLNHLLLKSVWRPACRPSYLAAFLSIVSAYFEHVAWESPTALRARVAALLPGLLLARVDGKSPAEYIVDDADKARIRSFSRSLLAAPVADPALIAERWFG
ncbi:MAG TPA: aminoglycoside phosphotransferase family protein [Casimicrobiaceae bacterium]|nr:aminoglycoside phosphotransferase family protein [Casimicrobiaceae bacterium]